MDKENRAFRKARITKVLLNSPSRFEVGDVIDILKIYDSSYTTRACNGMEHAYENNSFPKFYEWEYLDVPSYSDKIKAEYDRLCQKQLDKNQDYGDSAFEDVNVLGENIPAMTSCLSRMADKLKRLQSTDLKVDESIDDTLNDLVGYIVIRNILNKEGK